MKNILICLLACCCCPVFAAGTLRPAADDKTLVHLFEILKEEDNYGYDITITSRLENNNNIQRDTVRMSSYQSRRALLFYTKSADALFFLSRYGQFRVNTGDKTIYYQQYKNDSAAVAVMNAFRNPQILGSLDSLFLSGATIASEKKDKNALIYALQYPSSSAIKEMRMVYDTKATLFESIGYLFERRGPDGQSKFLQQVMMNHYSRSMPAEVQHLEERSRDLKTYLSSVYKGYTIKTI